MLVLYYIVLGNLLPWKSYKKMSRLYQIIWAFFSQAIAQWAKLFWVYSMSQYIYSSLFSDVHYWSKLVCSEKHIFFPKGALGSNDNRFVWVLCCWCHKRIGFVWSGKYKFVERLTGEHAEVPPRDSCCDECTSEDGVSLRCLLKKGRRPPLLLLPLDTGMAIYFRIKNMISHQLIHTVWYHIPICPYVS